jgi:hypothetical protein
MVFGKSSSGFSEGEGEIIGYCNSLSDRVCAVASMRGLTCQNCVNSFTIKTLLLHRVECRGCRVRCADLGLFSCWLLATNINVETVWRVASKEEAMPNRERTGAKLLRTYSKMAFNLRGSRCGPCRSLCLILLGP